MVFKLGRKTKYKAEHCQIAFDVLSDGGSIAEACMEIGISKQTFHNWQNLHKPFLDAIELGSTFGEGELWIKIRVEAFSGEGKLNYRFVSFVMRNQYRVFTSDTQAQLEGEVAELREQVEEFLRGKQ